MIGQFLWKITIVGFICCTALAVHTACGFTQGVSDREIYETGVLALSKGHVDFALRFFDMVLQQHPDSRYAAAACATKLGILLGHVRANQLLLEILRAGSAKARPERKADFVGAMNFLTEQKAVYITEIESTYRVFVSRYAEEVVTLRIAFLDISKDVDAVGEDLEKLEGGVWIPGLLLVGLFRHVQLLQTFADLLLITGVDFAARSLPEWLRGGAVDRLLVREQFFFHLGETLARENNRDLAVDALQRVVRLTQHQPYSQIRAQAIVLLEAMGEKAVTPDRPGVVQPGPVFPTTPTVTRPSVLFDETRLVTRPTGEKNCQISELAWFGCSDLAALLRASGYGVTSLQTPLITYQDLSQHDVFAILTTDHNYPYSFIEVLAIALYVERGGGLLICESTWQGKAQRDYTVGALARFFGADFIGNGMIRDIVEYGGGGVIRISHVLSHPITEGVSEFVLVEAAYLDRTGPATVLAYSSTESWFDDSTLPGRGVKGAGEPSGPLPVLAALEFGKGRVVLLADGMLFSNGWLSEADNRQLALNIFEWLARRR